VCTIVEAFRQLLGTKGRSSPSGRLETGSSTRWDVASAPEYEAWAKNRQR